MSGYARAHRGRWDHPLFKNKQEAAVWAWMTDTARFRAHSFQTRFGIVQLERGQLLVSQRTIADDFGLGRQQVRRLIDNLSIAGMIVENSTHSASRAGTIITIVNYERYQSDSSDECAPPTQGQPKRQPITNPRPTHNQPTREERGKREKGEERREEDRPSVSSPGAGDQAVAPSSATSLALVPASDDTAVAFAAFEAMRRGLNPAARAATLDPDRRKKLAARLSEIGGVEAWREVVGIVRGSPFLRGETSRTGRLVATIDWLLKPENLRKVREGNYDERSSNSRAAQPPIHGSAFDAILEARAILGRGGP